MVNALRIGFRGRRTNCRRPQSAQREVQVAQVAIDHSSLIGARVRAVRVRQGMSLDALADATGLSKAHLSRIERGERGLDRRSTLQTIADALCTPVEELTGQPCTPRNQAETAAHAAVLDIRDVLIATELGERPSGPPRPPATLKRELWRAEQLRGACDYAGFGPLLPGLLSGAHAAAAGEDRQTGLELVVRGCLLVDPLCAVTGHHELAWIAAERAHAAALLSENPTMVGAAEVLRGFVLMKMGLKPRERALAIVTAATEELARHPTTEESAEVLGMLHLIAASAHNAAGTPGPADDRLAEAAALAAYTGDGNAFDLWFGPANVGAWQVSMAVERGEGAAAAELAATVNSAMLRPSRRAAMLMNVGRALAQEQDRHQEAVHAFVRAEALGAQRVHTDPLAREAIRTLLFAAGGPELRGLARRAGVA
jgi:transcriptional regulator with XRE-family HTH domain